MAADDRTSKPLLVGRYAVFDAIAAGGMATVHFGQLLGPVGFSRVVAVKRLHEAFARDPEFVSAFLDEARLAARIRHPNVVPTLDVVAAKGELFLVMEYVEGESLARLCRTLSALGKTMPPRIAASIVSGTLQGLHAAHEAVDEHGRNLDIIHRDVSPQNILVGTDGTARVLDFGVAKAVGRHQTTRDGQIKGKLAYMPPEQLKSEHMTRQADIYAASVVLWETLTCERLFKGDTEAIVLARVLTGEPRKPSDVQAELAPFDAVTMKGLARQPEDRFATAREMALAVERCVGTASAAEVAEWLEQVAGPALRARAASVAAIETGSNTTDKHVVKAHLAALARGDSVPPSGAGSAVATRLGLGLGTAPLGVGVTRLAPATVPTEIQPAELAAIVHHAEPAPTSQASSVSLAVSRAAPRPPRPVRTVLLVGGVVLVLLVGAAGWGLRARDAARASASASATPPVAAEDATRVPIAALAAQPPVTAPVEPAVPSAVPSNVPSAAPTARHDAPPSRPAVGATSTSNKPKSRFDNLGGRE
jgi:eukaryotic-like serine/threonine-protein kinase